jgi:NAD(P)H-nitrite reductase large subunit
MNVLDTFGLGSVSFGQWQGVAGGDRVEVDDPSTDPYLRLEFDGDLLVGASTVGHTEGVGVIRALIQSRIHLGPWKDRLLADPTQIAAAYVARSQAA